MKNYKHQISLVIYGYPFRQIMMILVMLHFIFWKKNMKICLVQNMRNVGR